MVLLRLIVRLLPNIVMFETKKYNAGSTINNLHTDFQYDWSAQKKVLTTPYLGLLNLGQLVLEHARRIYIYIYHQMT